MMKHIKIVVVGDGAVGKTCLLTSFACNTFPEDYVPTVFDNTDVVLESDNGLPVKMELWDTAGQEDYDRLRPLSYPNSDAVLVCFSVDETNSLASVSRKWAPEVRRLCPRALWFLVGTKSDLRDQSELCAELALRGHSLVTREAAERVAHKLGAAKYLECSAKTRHGVRYLFDWVLRLVLSHEKQLQSAAARQRKNSNSGGHCMVM